MSEAQPRGRDSRFIQLAPALIGLLGVLVGAAATSGVTWLGDHNHAKADERGAERLVLDEVETNVVMLGRPVARPQLADGDWRAERERLARWLSNAEWAWVARYYRDLARRASGTVVEYRSERFRVDETCAMQALNASSYSSAPGDEEAREKNACNKPPPGGL